MKHHTSNKTAMALSLPDLNFFLERKIRIEDKLLPRSCEVGLCHVNSVKKCWNCHVRVNWPAKCVDKRINIERRSLGQSPVVLPHNSVFLLQSFWMRVLIPHLDHIKINAHALDRHANITWQPNQWYFK
jgi:hypothetical protein